jgi:hypothetical protein
MFHLSLLLQTEIHLPELKVRNTLFSLAGILNYDYEGKYLVTGSLRRDASSRFGANNKSGIFWSASAAWNIAKEDFMKGGFINDLKLRGSYGTTGNDGHCLIITTYQYWLRFIRKLMHFIPWNYNNTEKVYMLVTRI